MPSRINGARDLLVVSRMDKVEGGTPGLNDRQARGISVFPYP
jgi:hypothetical protein